LSKKGIAKTGLSLLSLTLLAVFLFGRVSNEQTALLVVGMVLLTGILMVINFRNPPID
jgi:hypothetical protein